MRALFFALVFLLPSLGAAAPDADFITYEAKHRPAPELVRVASGLFASRAKISEYNGKIIISAPESVGKSVLKLFAELDHPARKFRVRLRNRGNSRSEQRGAGAQVKGRELRVGVTDETTDSRGQMGQAVEMLEGSEALVGDAAAQVRLRLQLLGKDKVRASIQSAATQVLTTTELDLQLGEWQAISGLKGDKKTTQKGLFSASSGDVNSRSESEIFVELVPEASRAGAAR